MSLEIKYKEFKCQIDIILWDRDSIFIDFNSYWTRVVGGIAQRIAENTTTNWDKFNLVRTKTIKLLGVNPENSTVETQSPVNILPVSVFPWIISSGLKDLLPEKKESELNNLFKLIVNKALTECQVYLKEAILPEQINTIQDIFKKVQQVLVTNDSKENNDVFLKETKTSNLFDEILTEKNKEQLESYLSKEKIFITKNSFLKSFYDSKEITNVLLIDNLNDISFTETKAKDLATIHIDGASRGNPGHSAIGIVIYKDNNITDEISEYIGNHTNNFAEYTALIKALEISISKDYRNIEIKSDSELVVKQINKIYKVKDADIKELFDKANTLIKKVASFKIAHVPREENLKADKLANNALTFKNS